MCRRKSLPGPHQSIPGVGALPLEEPLLSFYCREGPLHLTLQRHPSSTPMSSRNGSNSGATKEKNERSPGKVTGEDGNIHRPFKVPRCPVRVASVCKVASESSNEAVSSKKHCLPFPRGTRSILVRPPCREGDPANCVLLKAPDMDGGKESQNN